MSHTPAMTGLAMPPARERAPGVLFGVASDLSMVALLVLSMWLIVRAGEQPPILHLTFAIVGVRALALGRAVFRYMERLASHNAALKQLSALRARTFERLIPLIPGGLRERRTGDIHASLVDDIDQLQDQPLRVWQPLVVSGATVTLGICMIALLSWVAAVINLLLCVLVTVLTWWLVHRGDTSARARLPEIRARLIDALIERFEAATVLHVFGVTNTVDARITALSREYTTEQRRLAGLAGVTSALVSFTAGAATLLTLWALHPGIGTEALSAPVFAALIIVPAALFEVLSQVPQALQARAVVCASAERLEGLLTAALPPEIPGDEPEANRELHALPSAPLIEVAGLAARYPGAECSTIRGVNFVLERGSTLLVTGESGAGKSTLAKVLVKFLDYEGSYRLEGVEARSLALQVVRSRVGLSEQNPHLFDADLRQNLKFAKPDASDTELLETLHRVGLREWAESREGLDTHVGEHGALVSGGQAGRIALARVLLADFPVVVLDEPTAGVDPETADAMMRDMLAAVPDDRAVIVISHTDLPESVKQLGRVQHIEL